MARGPLGGGAWGGVSGCGYSKGSCCRQSKEIEDVGISRLVAGLNKQHSTDKTRTHRHAHAHSCSLTCEVKLVWSQGEATEVGG